MRIDYKIIGKRIKDKRKNCGFTQESLAEKIGVSVGYISQIERGITHANLETLSTIAYELSCDITELLADVTFSGENFLNQELNDTFNQLSNSQKKMLLEIAEIIKNNK